MAQTATAGTPTIGEVIRAWRVFRGLRLIDLAEEAGVPKGYLSALEHDRKTNPWLGKLKKLAAALGISLQDIDDRRMPPATAEVQDHQMTDQRTRAIPSPAQSSASAPQAPVATPAEHQILEQLQTLTTAVSRLQPAVEDLKQRAVIPSPAQPSWPEDSTGGAPAGQPHPFMGEWQGYAWHYLPGGTPLTLTTKDGKRMVMRDGMTFLFAARLWLHSDGEAQVSGNGMLADELRMLPVVLVGPKGPFDMFITMGIVKDSQITLTLQNIEEDTRVKMTGYLSGDGQLIMGGYDAEGLLTQQHVHGTFFLLKTRKKTRKEEALPAGKARARERPE
jgi:transcriptional regulator with XRE-family HTH domain